jgi:tetratricopeptide (TPR) repeat protein
MVLKNHLDYFEGYKKLVTSLKFRANHKVERVNFEGKLNKIASEYNFDAVETDFFQSLYTFKMFLLESPDVTADAYYKDHPNNKADSFHPKIEELDLLATFISKGKTTYFLDFAKEVLPKNKTKSRPTKTNTREEDYPEILINNIRRINAQKGTNHPAGALIGKLSAVFALVYNEYGMNVKINSIDTTEQNDHEENTDHFDVVLMGAAEEAPSKIHNYVRVTLKDRDWDPAYHGTIVCEGFLHAEQAAYTGSDLETSFYFVGYWLLALDLYFAEKWEDCLQVLTTLALDYKNLLEENEAEYISDPTPAKDLLLTMAEVFHLRAVVLLKQPGSAPTEALEILNQTTQNHQAYLEKNSIRNARIAHNIGEAYRQQGKKELAQENFEEALELNPKQWESHLELGRLLFAQDMSNWKESYSKAIKYSDRSKDKIEEEIQELSLGYEHTITFLKNYLVGKEKRYLNGISFWK